jgi:hypothetical protein
LLETIKNEENINFNPWKWNPSQNESVRFCEKMRKGFHVIG